jgi:hypothetical protein
MRVWKPSRCITHSTRTKRIWIKSFLWNDSTHLLFNYELTGILAAAILRSWRMYMGSYAVDYSCTQLSDCLFPDLFSFAGSYSRSRSNRRGELLNTRRIELCGISKMCRGHRVTARQTKGGYSPNKVAVSFHVNVITSAGPLRVTRGLSAAFLPG